MHTRCFISCLSPPSIAGVQPEMQTLVERRIYPFLLMMVVLLSVLSFQIQQFKRLYEHIKNDKSVDQKQVAITSRRLDASRRGRAGESASSLGVVCFGMIT